MEIFRALRIHDAALGQGCKIGISRLLQSLDSGRISHDRKHSHAKLDYEIMFVLRAWSAQMLLVLTYRPGQAFAPFTYGSAEESCIITSRASTMLVWC